MSWWADRKGPGEGAVWTPVQEPYLMLALLSQGATSMRLSGLVSAGAVALLMGGCVSTQSTPSVSWARVDGRSVQSAELSRQTAICSGEAYSSLAPKEAY